MDNDCYHPDVLWIIDRIKDIWKRAEKNPSWQPTHRTIWRGCYDVWHDEQDRLDSINIPLLKMEEAEKFGYICKKILDDKYKTVIWIITEKGEELYKEKYVIQ